MEGDSPRKPIKRRCYSRKSTRHCVINMAEARKEIAHALDLHRSSLLSSSSSTPTDCDSKRVSSTMLGNNNFVTNSPFVGGNITSTSNYQYHCYSLMDTLPIPEPVWSTTAPSILAPPPLPPPISPIMEASEFDVDGNQAASSSWWLGILKTFDADLTGAPQYPCVDNLEIENSWDFGQFQNLSGLDEEPPLVMSSRDLQSSIGDEWLKFSTTEDWNEK